MHRNKNPCALAVFIKRSFTSLWIYTILLCLCAYAIFQHLMPCKKANAIQTTINKVSVFFAYSRYSNAEQELLSCPLSIYQSNYRKSMFADFLIINMNNMSLNSKRRTS